MPPHLMHFSTLSIGLSALFALSFNRFDSPPQLKTYHLQRVVPGRTQTAEFYNLQIEMDSAPEAQTLLVKLPSGEVFSMKKEQENRYSSRITSYINPKEGLKLYFEGMSDTLLVGPPLMLTTEIRN